MAEVTIFHNPRCSKSRQALDEVAGAGVEPRGGQRVQTGIVDFVRIDLDRELAPLGHWRDLEDSLQSGVELKGS